ncbi:unnamed protein product [Penicillium salamii]|uniref:Uncharacterized protein n=1 Tax=Penicillium salamii TaxID=1612424 RepID=A0A9W4JT75_9EURO|nr:unnamed protein product [Penicillium salamii]
MPSSTSRQTPLHVWYCNSHLTIMKLSSVSRSLEPSSEASFLVLVTPNTDRLINQCLLESVNRSTK